MRKLLATITALLICFGATSDRLKDDISFYDPVVAGTEPGANLNFAVLGDVHDNTEKLSAAIKDLYRLSRGMDALILNGDVVDQGLQEQYDEVQSTLDNNKALLPQTVIKNIGNHEFFDYQHGTNKPEDVKAFIDRYLNFSGEKNVYHDAWIKDYHFISLGSETGNTAESGSVKAYINKEQQNWLQDKLAEKYEKGKPIFVFLHQHLTSTFKGWVGVEQRDEINNILSKYPEVILFTSHTHVSLKKDNVTPNQPYTMAHTGAMAYVFEIGEEGSREKVSISQGLYVEVFGNKVIFKGRNFSDKSWIFSKDIVNKE